MRFKCRSCNEVHEGMPTFGWDHPVQYLLVPDAERVKRCFLTTDTCVIDDEFFFVRGCLEIAVHGEDERFAWGVWTSLSEENFFHFQELLGQDKRSAHGPFFGWLSSHIRAYPDTLNLKTMVHLRDGGIRPYVELQPSDHPLAVEQRSGISVERVAELVSVMAHAAPEAG